MKAFWKSILLGVALSLMPAVLCAQEETEPDEMEQFKIEVEYILNKHNYPGLSIGQIKVKNILFGPDMVTIFASENCAYIPFRENNVHLIYESIKEALPSVYDGFKVKVITDDRPIEELIPRVLRYNKDSKREVFNTYDGNPLVRNLALPYSVKKGLTNRHIAMWQSHGFYYEQKLRRWEWQRARIFETVEDLYTQGYVLPYLVPMLEHAGACVMLPRERDVNTEEYIIDNDPGVGQKGYEEQNGDKPWITGADRGFAYSNFYYQDYQNPFRDGTYRQAETITDGNESKASWSVKVNKTGYFAVYVSYKSLPNSTDEAIYEVNHMGGSTRVAVNQTMGGGTWIYIGTYKFDKENPSANKITLTNKSGSKGRMVTADGIKVGGGMGNIARGTTQKIGKKKIEVPYEISGYPRYTEGARYWLQWAGMPDSIYSESHGKNDYTDDYKSRGRWVNYISGGSVINPTENGLHVPVDMAFAFHSDAGTTYNDSIIGTLGIFFTKSYDGLYENRSSRYAARDLTDMIQSQIVNDVRTLYEPRWTRRGMWNKSYFEAKDPKVPTMLLELLSHQNFADMRYGLDPRFQFTVSRSIYKGITKFLAYQQKTDYAIQPLPVDNVNVLFDSQDNERAILRWEPVDDPIEPFAKAKSYVVYVRVDDGGFDNGRVVRKNQLSYKILPGHIYSFKVAALNDGGESFPSEIVSIGKAPQSKGTVLVVNGFDRISAPTDFVATRDSLAGFVNNLDHGVPYIRSISFVGQMKEFRRTIPWMDDDASGFGDSYGNYEKIVIAGNSFDYPYLHGQSIMQAGYSFVSSSNESVKERMVSLTDYPIVDWILGKQCQTKMGRGGVKPLEFKTFDSETQKIIQTYCNSGGSFFVSGSYVGTDLYDNPLIKSTKEDRDFAEKTLKYMWRASKAAAGGSFKSVVSPVTQSTKQYNYCSRMNPEVYAVESPDAIEPVDDHGYTFMRYSENNLSAGVAYEGNYKTCILGLPFESIINAKSRDEIMKSVLDFLMPKENPYKPTPKPLVTDKKSKKRK